MTWKVEEYRVSIWLIAQILHITLAVSHLPCHRDSLFVYTSEPRDLTRYFWLVDFGTPAQPQFVLLDTGSYELRINPDCTTLRNNQDGQFCRALGRYHAGVSSTAASLGRG